MNRLQLAIYGALPTKAQNLLCTVDGYRRWRHRFTPHFHRTLAEWKETALEPIEAHHTRQFESLKALIGRARSQTRYYGFLPDPIDLRNPSDSLTATLKEIPILEKSVYRARTLDFLASDVSSSQYEERSTSGTTGTALRLFDSHTRFAENYAAVWRQRESAGVSRDDAFFAFTGQITTPLSQRKPPFWRFDHHSHRVLFSLYHMSPDNLPAYVDAVHSLPARYVEGYPSALHVISRAMLDSGRVVEPGRLQAIFTSSETLLPHQRETIETAFGAPVRDHYAATEHVVSMTACALNNLHVDMEFGIVEVEVAEETDEWVRGSLIVTGLGAPAAPMIRYRIGDVGTRLKKPCPCGRPGDVFLEIDGRIEDYVVTRDGRVVGRMDHVFKGHFDIAEAQISQHSTDQLDVLVVPAADWNEASRHKLIRSFAERVGPDMRIEIELTDMIPREANGKFRAVRSTLGRSTRP